MPEEPSRPITKPSDAVSQESFARRVWLDNYGGFEEAATTSRDSLAPENDKPYPVALKLAAWHTSQRASFTMF